MSRRCGCLEAEREFDHDALARNRRFHWVSILTTGTAVALIIGVGQA